MDIIVLSDKVAEYIRRGIEFPHRKLDVSIEYDIERMGYLFAARAQLLGQDIRCDYFYHGDSPEDSLPAIAGLLAKQLNDFYRRGFRRLGEGEVIKFRPLKLYKPEELKFKPEPEEIYPPWD